MSSNSFTLKITVVHVLTILVEFFFFLNHMEEDLVHIATA